MKRTLQLVVAVGCAAIAASALRAAEPVSPAAASFEKLKALAGEWVEIEGERKGELSATYRVSSAGTSVVETLFPGSDHEMTSVYVREGDAILLTHYCAAGNQPRMRAARASGDKLVFAFDGGTNLDPAEDGHMHDGSIEFVSADEILAVWQGWAEGKPSDHSPRFHLARKR